MRTLATLALVCSASAYAQPTLSLLDIPLRVYPLGNRISLSGISNDGRTLVGAGIGDGGALTGYRWTAEGGLESLTAPEGHSSVVFGMSADVSTVVGWSDRSDGWHGLVWTQTAHSQLTFDKGEIRGVSANGSVRVGQVAINRVGYAARWTSLSTPQVIGPPNSEAYAVSADGSVIAGIAIMTDGSHHVFRWTVSGGYSDLGGSVPGSSGAYTTVRALSADGSTIIGTSISASGYGASRWTAATGFQLLSTDAAGSEAMGLSSDGSVIVGHVEGQSQHAFYWSESAGTVDLRDYLISLGCTTLQSWQLLRVDVMSVDSRLIAGWAYDPLGGFHEYLITLNGRCGSADFNGDGDIGTDADIAAFFRCLSGDCCPACFGGGADFDGNGDVGTDRDIEAFFRVLGGNAC